MTAGDLKHAITVARVSAPADDGARHHSHRMTRTERPRFSAISNNARRTMRGDPDDPNSVTIAAAVCDKRALRNVSPRPDASFSAARTPSGSSSSSSPSSSNSSSFSPSLLLFALPLPLLLFLLLLLLLPFPPRCTGRGMNPIVEKKPRIAASETKASGGGGSSLRVNCTSRAATARASPASSRAVAIACERSGGGRPCRPRSHATSSSPLSWSPSSWSSSSSYSSPPPPAAAAAAAASPLFSLPFLEPCAPSSLLAIFSAAAARTERSLPVAPSDRLTRRRASATALPRPKRRLWEE